MGLPLRVYVEKTHFEMETYWLSGKEKVLGATIS